MKRCALCDYTEESGSSYLNISKDGRKILWNETHQEYQCTVCMEEIRKLIPDDIEMVGDKPPLS